MQIGSHTLQNKLMLAPMAGITDVGYRNLCRNLGAAYTVGEMVTANSGLWHTNKSQARLSLANEPSPRVVQLVGTDPQQMATAAQRNVDRGADIIDINMGCPVKKVCKVFAGSALLTNEDLVKRILTTVVQAVDVPVTLKIRTGVDPAHRNGVRIGKIAEQSGIQMLAVHGRTRACRFRGDAEYETISNIKKSINIPVVANGDINSPEKAKKVLAITNADAIMIGRAAQGRPWFFREIDHYLKFNKKLDGPPQAEVCTIMLTHLEELYSLYGKQNGVRIARKHIGWYLDNIPGTQSFKKTIFAVSNANTQFDMVRNYLQYAETKMEMVT